ATRDVRVFDQAARRDGTVIASLFRLATQSRRGEQDNKENDSGVTTRQQGPGPQVRAHCYRPIPGFSGLNCPYCFSKRRTAAWRSSRGVSRFRLTTMYP